MAANPTIKNPNRIAEGQQIIIPVPPASGADRRLGGAVGERCALASSSDGRG